MRKITIRTLVGASVMAIVMCAVYSIIFYMIDYNNRSMSNYIDVTGVFIWFKPLHIILSFILNFALFGTVFYLYLKVSERELFEKSYSSMEKTARFNALKSKSVIDDGFNNLKSIKVKPSQKKTVVKMVKPKTKNKIDAKKTTVPKMSTKPVIKIKSYKKSSKFNVKNDARKK